MIDAIALEPRAVAGSRGGGSPARARPAIDWHHDGRYAGLLIARARMPDPRGGPVPIVGWGRSHDARRALVAAIGEVAERHALHSPVAGAAVAMIAHGQFIPPHAFARFTPDQMAGRDDLREPRSGQPETCVRGREWFTAEPAWLPAECVHPRACLPGLPGRRVLLRPTSSGCAADVHKDTAVARAALEAIERDAVARHWLAQVPGRSIDAVTWPDDLREAGARLEEKGCDVVAVRLELGLGPVVAVLVSNAPLQFACLGSAAAASAEEALRHAFAEAAFAAVTRCHAARPCDIEPQAVTTPRDHSDLFAGAHWRRALVLHGSGPAIPWQEVAAGWPAWRDRLRVPQAGSSHLAPPGALYVADLTRDDSPVQLDGSPLHVVRALVPGCVPLAFGPDALPRGMVPFDVMPAGRFPHPLA